MIPLPHSRGASATCDEQEDDEVIQGASHLLALMAVSEDNAIIKNVVIQGKDRLLCGRSLFEALISLQDDPLGP